MKWKIIFFIGLFVATLVSPAWAQSSGEQPVYVVGIDTEYAPYEFVDASGDATGFTVELLTKLGQQAGVTFRFVPMSPTEAIEGLEKGTIDLVNMIQTPERAQRYELSNPHSRIEQAIFSRSGTNINGPDTLSGYRVALQENDIALEKLANRTDFQKIIVRSKEDGFLMLNSGKADAFLVSEQAGFKLIDEYQLKNIEIADVALYPQPYGFAARKGNTALIALLNTHLQTLKNSGEYEALINKWLTVPSVENNWLIRYQSSVISGGAILIVVSIMLFAWTFSLRRAVKIRTQSLQESEERYRILFQRASDGILYMSSDLHVLAVNESFARMHGYTTEEMQGVNIKDLDTEESKRFLPERVQRILDEEVIEFEVEHIHKDGHIFPLSVSASMISVNGKNIIQAFHRDITERKQAEQNLKESTARLHALFDYSPLSIWDEDFSVLRAHLDALRKNGVSDFRTYFDEHPDQVVRCSDMIKIVDINETSVDFFQAGRKANIPKNLSFYFSDESYSVFKEEIIALAEGQTYFESELPIRMLDGDNSIILLNLKVVPGYEESWAHVVVSFLDITNRKQAEEKLRDSEERYRIISNLTSDYAYSLRLESDGKFVREWTTDAFSKITGYLPTDPEVESGISAIVYPDDRHIFEERNYNNTTNDDDTSITHRIIRKDGQIRWLHNWRKPIRDEETGKIIRFYGAIRDITERKQAENAVLWAQERYHGLFEKAPVMYIITRHPAPANIPTIIECNQVFLNTLNYTLNDVIGKPLSDFYTARSRKAMLEDGGYKRALENRFTIEERELVTRDGKVINTMLTTAPETDAQGNVIGTLAMYADISDRKQAEQALQKAHDELEQRVIERTADLNEANSELIRASRLKDEFLSSMSHELRTPLTGILGLAESLQMKTYGELSERQLKALRNIELSGQHLLELINDILDLSKIEAGRFDMSLVSCSVFDVCQASLEIIKGMANQRHHRVSFSMNPSTVIVQADSRRLKQMLVNLLSNAIKFTPENGQIGLEVQGNTSAQMVELTVWDKGIGIKPEDIQQLFKPFVQIDGRLAREYSGTGLGLSLVKRMADLHGGSVKVESVFGEGSRFTILLPWVATDAATASVASANNVLTQSSPTSTISAPNILIADDNEVVLEILKDFLLSQKYNVVIAHSGEELLTNANEVQPDLFLIDIQMPGMDGLETIRRIRAHAKGEVAATPVIAVTALAMSGDRELCLAAGANDYLSKPIQLPKLLSTIQNLLSKTKKIYDSN